MKKIKTLIIGASNNESRYSYKALKLLQEYGHDVVLLHPTLEQIDGIPVHHHLSDINENIHTITLYVNSSISSGLTDEIIALNPKRVIFNPGTENDRLMATLRQHHIVCQYACTLILLKTGQYAS